MRTLTTIAPQKGLFSEREYAGDPFEHIDGHFVGHDGFVVPNDFAEFYQRFPDYIRRWVKRHAWGRSSNEDIDDWTQDLCAHMSSLPATSKYRESGKRDVIQSFDPFRQYGASLRRFLNYINRCLANKFRTIHLNRMKNPLSHADPLSPHESGEVASVDDEPHRTLLERLMAVDVSSQKQAEDKLLIAEFVAFVRVENPRFLRVLEAIAVTRTQGEAARTLGIAGTDVSELIRQVRDLGRSFLSRKARPMPWSRCDTCYGTKMRASLPGRPYPLPRPSRKFGDNCWNRVVLYNEVWNQPLIKLSRKYRVSDVRLGKVCRKLKIPHPGRGYWAKRAVGQVVEQVPLPEFKGAPVVTRLRKTRSRGLFSVIFCRSLHPRQGRGESKRGAAWCPVRSQFV
ncbi:MAG TPA: hypothetical protein VK788_10830 [Terriglobales bacterium]|jgi:hypothetical protein|nr:hypothetical protein [Terriglobales bacterium]